MLAPWEGIRRAKSALERRPAPADLGLDVTIAIAAFVSGSDHIVTISDARLSHGEAIQAADNATMKNRKIASKWGMMFAASDSTAFVPIITGVQHLLKYTGDKQKDVDVKAAAVIEAVQSEYEKEFNERFFREHLARFGFADIADFRRSGFNEMGKDLYGQYADALARFDLGLELLVYGFSPIGERYLFEVANPGKVISHNLSGYAAIGSGSLMAQAAINRKPIAPDLAETIYRLLDAKFSSETARDVGRKTHVITSDSSGNFGLMLEKDVESIREIWRQTIARPEPREALDIIKKSGVITGLSGYDD